MSKRCLATLTLLSVLTLPVAAQAPRSVDQAELLQRRRDAERLTRQAQEETPESVPAISPEEAFDVGPQYILKTRERHRWFEVGFDSQYSWTDNMFFEERDSGHTVSSTVLTSAARLTLETPAWSVASGKMAARAGYNHIWMNYALTGQKLDPLTGFRKSDNDFDAPSLFGELSQTWEHWQATVGADWLRLLSHQPTYGSYDQFYRDYAIRWSLTRTIELGTSHSLLAGYLGSRHFTGVDPSIPGLNDRSRNDRTDHTLLLGYTYKITQRLALQPSYRLQFSGYDEAGRQDLLHSFNGSLVFGLNRWLFVRTYGGCEIRESNDTLVSDYRKWDLGVSLGATLRF